MNALLSNSFKERLRKGEVQIGLWQKLPPLPVMTGC